MGLKEGGYVGIDWIYLAEDSDQWRDPVSTVMLVPRKAGDFLTSSAITSRVKKWQVHELAARCDVTSYSVRVTLGFVGCVSC
jgi:hypothetical protein